MSEKGYIRNPKGERNSLISDQDLEDFEQEERIREWLEREGKSGSVEFSISLVKELHAILYSKLRDSTARLAKMEPAHLLILSQDLMDEIVTGLMNDARPRLTV
jgi:hypothetical protein